MAIESSPEIDYRVTLRNSTSRREFVKFLATPDLIETRNVNYKTIEPVHAPGQIMAYVSTSSRTFNLSNIKLISRTPAEAALNLQKLWLLRSWTMPQFGTSTLSAEQQGERDFFAGDSAAMSREQLEIFGIDYGAEQRGRPPAVLLLSAYSRDSSFGGKVAEHINRVPVVIANLNIPYPSDVDYIPAEGSNVPMPTIMALDIVLSETHSPREYERFNLSSFKRGVLPGF
jgi:hypothetical protein